MTTERIVRSAAGTMILLSLALTYYHSHKWVWLTLFVGLNLFQSGFTNWCLLDKILGKAGVKSGGGCCGSNS
ncbi:MAG: DUF2892 domain-containing protein [Firmicutes bacterium]|nr:DUF2892 domain-containing protein [Bacillota bacterium]